MNAPEPAREPVLAVPPAGHPLVLQLALVAAGYWATAKLALLLAIPPGYATAVWPPAGIALAGALLCGWRVAPAVWLGSFLANLPNGFDASSAAALGHSLVIPASIATGAAAQALAGAALIERLVGYRNILTQELSVVPMLLLGGPLACIIGATVGVTTLQLAGAVPADGYVASWGTWWVGDSVGVLVVTPLVLLWAVRPRAAWLQRQVLVTLPLAGLLVLVVTLFIGASQRESNRIRAGFEATAAGFVAGLHKELEQYVALVTALRGLMENAPGTGPAEFARFSELVIGRMPPGTTAAWLPRVPQAGRAAFERAQQAAVAPDFEIRQLGADGQLVRAGERAEHVPVTYIFPPDGNLPALGFDLTSLPDRVAAMALARQTGRPALTDPTHLVQDRRDRIALLIVAPVLRPPGGAPEPELAGYVSAAFRSPEMMSRALRRLESQGVRLTLTDPAAPLEQRLIYRSPDAGALRPGDLELHRRIDLLGTFWDAALVLPADYLVSHRSLHVWAVLAAGMLFAGLFGVFVLVMIGRTARVETLVAERTAKLAHEVRRGERLQQEMRLQAEKLAASNRELEQFAYVASHDLQAPLRTVASFAGLLRHRYAATLDDAGRDFLDAIEEGTRAMKALIMALLDLSRVSAERAAMTAVPLGEALDSVRRHIAKDLADAGASVSYGSLPTVRGDRKMLERLFENLLTNAVKFRAPGAHPVVVIEAGRVEGGWSISVRDNGIGIPADALGDIFLLFHRLHPADRYAGTGIGLAICKKIAELHQGSIRVESEPGKGSTFVVTLPA
ncbi:MAG TPA: CHASE domain-containing protein [Solimonas sp.]|nr:CHASE domain-containing protein [Solimonas sp.]